MLLPWLFGVWEGCRRARSVGARPAPARRAVRPGVEALEERCAPSADLNPAVVPAPSSDPAWVLQTRVVSARRRGHPRVIFLGDSITEFFIDGVGAAVWRHRVAPLRADNFAVRSSTTQNLLFQINRGLLSNLNARLVVLMIGINNLLAGESPQQTAAGVAACVSAIRNAQPRARILLLDLLPAGWTASTPLRAAVAQTNALLPPLADRKVVHWADVGWGFLRSDGSIAPGMMIDGIHPTARGYRTIAASLGGTLWELVHAPRLPPPKSPRPGPHGGRG
jgi:lysophospholipase L1-like esterase